MFVLAGTSEGTGESKEFLCELIIGVATQSDPVGSILVDFLNSVEGEG